MTREHDIEAQLDRSLGKQIAVPQLDQRFNDAVWSRIAESDARATAAAGPEMSPRGLAASRWLAVSNGIGITVALAIAAYFATHAFAQSGISVVLNVPVPRASWMSSLDSVRDWLALNGIALLGNTLGLAALAFGIGLTSFGRRIRASFG